MTDYATYKNVYCNLDLTVPAYAAEYAALYNSLNHNYVTRLQFTNYLDFDLDEDEINDLPDWEKDEMIHFTPPRYGDEFKLPVFGNGVLHKLSEQDCYGGPASFIFLMEDGKFRIFSFDDFMCGDQLYDDDSGTEVSKEEALS